MRSRFLCYSLLTLISSFLAFCVNASVSYAFDCSTAININVPVSECQALHDLYNSTNGSGWTVDTNRDTDTDVCTWHGISCQTFSGQARVVSIGTTGSWYTGSLSNNNLVGSLPSSLSVLTKLKVLVLSWNRLQGTLSPSFASRSDIEHIDISSNRFNGALPSSLGAWSNIQYVDLSYNRFNGILPSSLGNRSYIWNLRLSSNEFTGAIPLSLSNLSSLEYFDISFNHFNGTLPSGLSSWSSIKHVGLDSNNFTGGIPSSFSAWINIETFHASHNNFNGTLPSSLANRSLIDTFDVRNNYFAGVIPSSWSNRGVIKYFWVSNNNLYGLLPSSLSARTNIQEFWVDNNHLVGPVPSAWTLGMPNNIGYPYMHLRNNCLQTNGYSNVMQSWLTTNAVLSPQNICTRTVTYIASTGGTISGTVVQNLTYGQTGTAVTAIPNRGCIFSGWSDGSFINPRTDTGSINNITFTAIFSCNTIPVNASGVAVPAISFWLGKVNQHFNTSTMSRQTDPTGTRGGGSSIQWGANGWGDRPLAYCRIFWPATIAAVSLNNLVTIHTWMGMGNTMPYYSASKKAYRCVQSLGQNGNPLPNRYSAPTTTSIPIARDITPIVDIAPSTITVVPSNDPVTSYASSSSSSITDRQATSISDVHNTIPVSDAGSLRDSTSPSLSEEKATVSDTVVAPISYDENSSMEDPIQVITPIMETTKIFHDEVLSSASLEK